MKLYDEMMLARRKFFESYNLRYEKLDSYLDYATIIDYRKYKWKLERDVDGGCHTLLIYNDDQNDYKWIEVRVVDKYYLSEKDRSEVGEISMYGCVNYWTHDNYEYILLDDTKQDNIKKWEDSKNMRNLASVRQIDGISEIEGADKICTYRVGGWAVVDQKGKYEIGELVVYFEIDSFLPIKDEFEFLRKSSYKVLVDGTEGFRLRTIKLRGQVSQGLLVKLPEELRSNVEIGDELTDYFGVTKYEAPIPAEISGEVKGHFPTYVPKTDEERVQNINEEEYIGKRAVVTEKIDGTSATFYINGGIFGVCGRNYEYKYRDGNSFFKVASKLGIEEKLRGLGRNVAIQGELYGYGIQQNKYNMTKQSVIFFTGHDIDTGKRMGHDEFSKMISDMGLETVPLLNYNIELGGCDELLKMAEGKSVLNSNTEREGIVIRGLDSEFSFKCISNKFLLKDKS